MKEKIFFVVTAIVAAVGIFCFMGDFIKSVGQTYIVDDVIPERIKESGKIIADFEKIGLWNGFFEETTDNKEKE